MSSGALAATGEHEKVTTSRSRSRSAAAAIERPRRRCGRRGDSSSVAMAPSRAGVAEETEATRKS